MKGKEMIDCGLSRGCRLLTGPVVLNKVSRRIWSVPLNGVFQYLFLSAYIDRMKRLVSRWLIEAVV